MVLNVQNDGVSGRLVSGLNKSPKRDVEVVKKIFSIVCQIYEKIQRILL